MIGLEIDGGILLAGCCLSWRRRRTKQNASIIIAIRPAPQPTAMPIIAVRDSPVEGAVSSLPPLSAVELVVVAGAWVVLEAVELTDAVEVAFEVV